MPQCCAFPRCAAIGQDAKLQLGNLDKLSDKAARVTDVTLDGSLLQFAVNLIEKVDANDKDVEQLQSIIKNLKGIYIKSFEFDEASQYSKARRRCHSFAAYFAALEQNRTEHGKAPQ